MMYKLICEIAKKDIDINILFPEIEVSNDSFLLFDYISKLEKIDDITIVKISSHHVKRIINMMCPRCNKGIIKPISYDMNCDNKYILPPGAYDNRGIHPNMGCDSCNYYFEILI